MDAMDSLGCPFHAANDPRNIERQAKSGQRNTLRGSIMGRTGLKSAPAARNVAAPNVVTCAHRLHQNHNGTSPNHKGRQYSAVIGGGGAPQHRQKQKQCRNGNPFHNSRRHCNLDSSSSLLFVVRGRADSAAPNRTGKPACFRLLQRSFAGSSW